VSLWLNNSRPNTDWKACDGITPTATPWVYTHTTSMFELDRQFGANYTSAKFHVCLCNCCNAIVLTTHFADSKSQRSGLRRTDGHNCVACSSCSRKSWSDESSNSSKINASAAAPTDNTRCLTRLGGSLYKFVLHKTFTLLSRTSVRHFKRFSYRYIRFAYCDFYRAMLSIARSMPSQDVRLAVRPSVRPSVCPSVCVRPSVTHR